ncbi:MAG: TRAP transporter large permease subunit, partial [Cytophagales bacterium]|nr:TRAP transporter large permease subunit [Rhizobacter sp.]
SFMHPPFGFALFYLRGISDTLFKNNAIPEKVKSNDIYMGAIPWVILQLVLVVIVIFFPQTVTVFLDKEAKFDLDKVKIEAPTESGYGDKNQNIDDLFKARPADGAASTPK